MEASSRIAALLEEQGVSGEGLAVTRCPVDLLLQGFFQRVVVGRKVVLVVSLVLRARVEDSGWSLEQLGVAGDDVLVQKFLGTAVSPG